MLTEIYIEALLVDEELADQVWEAWDTRLISGEMATWVWGMIQDEPQSRCGFGNRKAITCSTSSGHWPLKLHWSLDTKHRISGHEYNLRDNASGVKEVNENR